MKVGILIGDHDPRSGGAFTLLETVKRQILEAKEKKNDYVFLFSDRDSPEFISVDSFCYINYYRPRELKWRRRIKKILHIRNRQEPVLDQVAKKYGIDLVWFVFPIEMQLSIPYVYTIWDLGHRILPMMPEVSNTGWSWDDREKCYQGMVYRATRVITGNQTGRKEIIANYPIDPGKIRIIPFPIPSFCFGNEHPPSFSLPESYFFYPAQFWPHKNHVRIVQALKILRDEHGRRYTVVFSGSDKGNKAYIEKIAEDMGVSDSVIFAGFVSDEELKYLYRNARAMIFASLLGPNNMPPIEATYLSCPVLITDIDGHREQLGNSALYFSGIDARDLAEKMMLIDEDSSLRSSLAENQRKLADEIMRHNYFVSMDNVVAELGPYRECWGREYVHS